MDGKGWSVDIRLGGSCCRFFAFWTKVSLSGRRPSRPLPPPVQFVGSVRFNGKSGGHCNPVLGPFSPGRYRTLTSSYSGNSGSGVPETAGRKGGPTAVYGRFHSIRVKPGEDRYLAGAGFRRRRLRTREDRNSVGAVHASGRSLAEQSAIV